MTVSIIFDPLQQVVSSVHGEVSLNRQTSLCLSYLLKHEDEFISKQQIIEKCWEPRGVIVSEGSVRQVLFMLRRAFNKLGAPGETLTTRPKVGYRLKAGVVQLRSNPVSMPVDTTSSSHPYPSQPASDFKFFSAYNRRVAYFIVGIILLAATLSSGGLSLHRMLTSIDYEPLAGNVGPDVHSFVQRGLDKNLAKADLRAVLSWRDNGLVRFPPVVWIYINRSEPQNASAFVCDKQISDADRTCFSITGIGRIP